MHVYLSNSCCLEIKFVFHILIRKLTQKDTSILHRCSSSMGKSQISFPHKKIIFVMLQNQAAWVIQWILTLPNTRPFFLMCNLFISMGRSGGLQKFISKCNCFLCFLTAPSTCPLYTLLPRPSAAVGVGLLHLSWCVSDVAEGQHKTHHDGSQVLAFKAADGQLHGAVHGCRNALRDQPVQVYGPAKELRENMPSASELAARLQDKLYKDYETPQINRLPLCEPASQTHWNKADGQNL